MFDSILLGPKKDEQKKQELDRRQSLAGVPVFNQNVSIRRDEENSNRWLIVVKTRGKKQGFLSRFGPTPAERHFGLDQLGTFVATHIDGKHTVKDIVDAFIRKYNVNRREAELSVTQFFKMLTRKKIVSILIK